MKLRKIALALLAVFAVQNSTLPMVETLSKEVTLQVLKNVNYPSVSLKDALCGLGIAPVVLGGLTFAMATRWYRSIREPNHPYKDHSDPLIFGAVTLALITGAIGAQYYFAQHQHNSALASVGLAL